MHINFKLLNRKKHLKHPQIEMIRKSALNIIKYRDCERLQLPVEQNSDAILLLNKPMSIETGIEQLHELKQKYKVTGKYGLKLLQRLKQNTDETIKHLKDIDFLKDQNIIGYIGGGTKSITYLLDNFQAFKVTKSNLHNTPIALPEYQAIEYGKKKIGNTYNILQEWGVTNITKKEFDSFWKTVTKAIKENPKDDIVICDYPNALQAARFIKKDSTESIKLVDSECIARREDLDDTQKKLLLF